LPIALGHAREAQPFLAVREPALLAVEDGHGHRRVADDVPELAPLLLEGLLGRPALGDVARHGLDALDVPLLAHELDVLADPDLAAVPGHRHELVIAARRSLPVLAAQVLLHPRPVVGPYHLEV